MDEEHYADYLSKVFDSKSRKKVVVKITKLLKNTTLKYDGIVVTGVSGITIGILVAHALNVDLVIVRKETLKCCHSTFRVENGRVDGRYVFLDDCIDSGRTFSKVKKLLKTECSAKIVGKIFYDDITVKIHRGDDVD